MVKYISTYWVKATKLVTDGEWKLQILKVYQKAELIRGGCRILEKGSPSAEGTCEQQSVDG